jgi:hypothetical protein
MITYTYKSQGFERDDIELVKMRSVSSRMKTAGHMLSERLAFSSKVMFPSLPTYAFALSRFVCGLPAISSRDPFAWHHASRLSQTHQSDVLFLLAQSLASDAFCEALFQI